MNDRGQSASPPPRPNTSRELISGNPCRRSPTICDMRLSRKLFPRRANPPSGCKSSGTRGKYPRSDISTICSQLMESWIPSCPPESSSSIATEARQRLPIERANQERKEQSASATTAPPPFPRDLRSDSRNSNRYSEDGFATHHSDSATSPRGPSDSFRAIICVGSPGYRDSNPTGSAPPRFPYQVPISSHTRLRRASAISSSSLRLSSGFTESHSPEIAAGSPSIADRRDGR